MEPSRDCPRCQRLVEFRELSRQRQPDWFNAPVPTFGSSKARLLVVGLAPGLKGANRTGRPFTGDHAGDLLYATLGAFGFAEGTYDRRTDDGLALRDCAITNAVRCVPPENKPLPVEITACRPFLVDQIAAMPGLLALVALGRIAHEGIMRALGAKLAANPFGHGRCHEIARADGNPVAVFDSFHCSRYNTSTKLLTPEMFRAVFAAVAGHLAAR